jgi:hypothetical protein
VGALTPCATLAELWMGAAQGSGLDRMVLALLDNTYANRQKRSRKMCLRRKFVTFCLEQGALPIIPTKPTTFFRYALWLCGNGINSGWDGAQKYITAAVHFNREFGYGDFRDLPNIDWWWGRFRHEFKILIPVRHRAMKLPIRAGHIEAIALGANLDNALDLRDLTMYFFLFYCGVRIGHVAHTTGGSMHCLRFGDVFFSPSFEACEIFYVCFRSTKTRPRAADTPYWSAIRRQPQLPWCPMELLRRHYRQAFRGDPQGVVFTAQSGAPLSRSTFTTTLRRRLAQAAPYMTVAIDLSKFSGISFRKGCLSTLGALGVPSHRLADHADHGSVESSRGYTVDTLSDRAGNSCLIATAFAARL